MKESKIRYILLIRTIEILEAKILTIIILSPIRINTVQYPYFVIDQLVDEDEEDVYTLSKLGDLFHALFSTHKEQFLPVFDQLLIHVNKLLVSVL